MRLSGIRQTIDKIWNNTQVIEWGNPGESLVVYGEVSEWSKERAWRARRGLKVPPGFESLPLRIYLRANKFGESRPPIVYDDGRGGLSVRLARLVFLTTDERPRREQLSNRQ